jgi:hypothetical protein
MSNAAMLRERAATCREMAREYHPSVGMPLLQKAMELDREASELERNGRERRRAAGGLVLAPARTFGRRGARRARSDVRGGISQHLVWLSAAKPASHHPRLGKSLKN